jgi:autotransporter passenger strand-loop-strand repeat protein
MKINVVFDSSVASAPAGFTTAINYVVNLYDTLFTNPISITIDVGWGEIDGTALGSGDLGESMAASEGSYTYTQVRDALIAGGQSSAQLAAYATLPVADVTISEPYYPNGSTVYVAPAEAEALGLISSYNGAVGYVGFSSSNDWSFAQNVTPSANDYYFVGVAEHEISEIMGRVSQVDSDGISTMDLFRYSAPGVFDFTPDPPSPYTTAYFSIDGGNTVLNYWNTVSGADYGDWAPSAGYDAYLAAGYPGAILALSPTDITLMNAIGWDTVTSGVTVSAGERQTVEKGQTIDATIVLSGGVEIVHSGGTVSGATVRVGGADYVTGVDDGAVVQGFQEVASGGDVSGARFSAGGGQTILSGGVADQITIGGGGYEYVEAGGLVSGATVLGFQEIDSGGSAAGVTVSSGGSETVAAGGSASAIVVAFGGLEYVKSGAVVSEAQIGGYQEVDSGGVASGVTVSSGGCETVAAGGSVIAITIDHGGYEYVLSGATAASAVVLGYQEVDSGGGASGVTISSGGCETVSAGGSASAVTIDHGGFEYIKSGAAGSAVQVGGYQEIDSRGAASGVTVSSGACETVLGDGSASAVTVDQGGYSFVQTGAELSGADILGYQQVDGGTVSDVTISSGGGQNVYSGGLVSGVTVALGASEFVYSGTVSGGTVLGYQEIDGHGSAIGVTVSSGGSEAVEAGGIATNITVAGGQEVVSSGATAGGAFTFTGTGGRLMIDSGAIFNATISGFAAGDRFNLAAIDFASATIAYANNTLTVSDGTNSIILDLLGQYMAAGFQDASNGAGGTLVTYNAAQAQTDVALLAPGH